MKRILIFFALLAFSYCKAQQVPWNGIEVGNLNNLNGTFFAPYDLYAPIITQGPVVVSGNSHVDFIAGDRVHLQPGFSTNNITGNGYFHAQIGANPDFDVVFIEPDEHIPQVGRFEKLEMGIQLPLTLDQQVSAFIQNPANGINPFDPAQISVEAVFTSGSTSYTVYGFYFDDFTRDPNAMAPNAAPVWLPVATNYHWRIRFAPPTLGQWFCSISIKLNNSSSASYQVGNVTFNCINSANKGFLKKGINDWYLAYSGTNESFFGIGQDIPWIDNGKGFRGSQTTFSANPSMDRLFEGGFLDVQDWVTDLKNSGGNMFRVVNIEWSYEFEFEHLNNYTERLNRAWELDQLFNLSEQEKMKMFFTFEMILDWNTNPYHTQITNVNFLDDMLIDPEAIRIMKNKFRYFLSRWGYSTSLGVLQLMNEIDIIDKYNDNGHYGALANNTDACTHQKLWHLIMSDYAKSLVRYRNLLTATSFGFSERMRQTNPNPNDLSSIDVTNCHGYNSDREKNIQMFHDLNNPLFNRGNHSLWPDKPVIIDELGTLASSSPDAGDFEGCNDISFHNSLWATSFMGGFCTGFNWWQHFNSVFRHDNFPALKTFFDGIDFEFINFKNPQFWDDAPSFDIDNSSSKIETFCIADDNGRRAMGWIHNTTYYWGNLDYSSCTDRHNTPAPSPPDDDDDPATPQSLGNYFVVEVHGLNLHKNYTIDYYNTQGNGGLINSLTKWSNIFGTLKPNWIGNSPDIAFKAYRSGDNFRETNEIDYDTLFCWEDTIYTSGIYENDTLGQLHYKWNFGNGQISSGRNSVAIYNQPGTYLVTLIVSDSMGWSDTLQEYIVKPLPCNSSTRISQVNQLESSSSWNAFPNPATTELTLTFDSTWSSTVIVELYSLDGRCIVCQSIPFSSEQKIPLEQLTSGVYLLRVKDDKRSEIKKIIIEH